MAGFGALFVAFVFLIFFNVNRAPVANTAAVVSAVVKTNRELALSCTTDMATQFHIHPHLDIFINGQKSIILADIGIVSDCMHPLHTHDATGKIHVESPEKRDFTLGDFFAVWQKTYTKDQILDYKIDATHKIIQTVNGKQTQDFENTLLRDGDQIIIYYEAIKK